MDNFVNNNENINVEPHTDARKKKKAIIAIAVVMIILIVAAAALVKMNSAGMSADADRITVALDSQEQAVFEISDIESFEYVDIKKNIKSGSGPDEEGTFRCVDIKDIAAAAGITLTGDEKRITVKCADGYTTSFEMDEVMAENCILLAYQKNGEPLGDKSSGGNGPFRMIAADDPFGMRCCKYVNAIDVERE